MHKLSSIQYTASHVPEPGSVQQEYRQQVIHNTVRRDNSYFAGSSCTTIVQNWWGLQLPLQAFKTITQAVGQLFNNGAQCVQLLADTWSKEDLTEAHISMANILA